MLLAFDEFLFFCDRSRYALKICRMKVLFEVVAMKVRSIAIMPEKLEFPQMFVEVDVVSENPKMQFLGYNSEVFGDLLAFERSDHMSSISLGV